MLLEDDPRQAILGQQKAQKLFQEGVKRLFGSREPIAPNPRGGTPRRLNENSETVIRAWLDTIEELGGRVHDVESMVNGLLGLPVWDPARPTPETVQHLYVLPIQYPQPLLEKLPDTSTEDGCETLLLDMQAGGCWEPTEFDWVFADIEAENGAPMVSAAA